MVRPWSGRATFAFDLEVSMRALVKHDLVITDLDLQRLAPVLDGYASPVTEMLDWELHRATVVPHHAIPRDVVTMNSDVTYEDSLTGARRTVRVVFPKDADAGRGYVSVLAPIGSALLGLKVGQRIDWPFPKGRRTLTVVEIPYQPEAAGDYHL
jgi:regulator of nucleoside diphosphate kinase